MIRQNWFPLPDLAQPVPASPSPRAIPVSVYCDGVHVVHFD